MIARGWTRVLHLGVAITATVALGLGMAAPATAEPATTPTGPAALAARQRPGFPTRAITVPTRSP